MVTASSARQGSAHGTLHTAAVAVADTVLSTVTAAGAVVVGGNAAAVHNIRSAAAADIPSVETVGTPSVEAAAVETAMADTQSLRAEQPEREQVRVRVRV